MPVIDTVKTPGLPTHLIPSKSYTFNITDITDPENEDISLAISNVSSGITINNLTPALDESIELIVNNDAIRGGIESFTITATDKSGSSISKIISLPVNKLIDPASLISWAPRYRLVCPASNLNNLTHKPLVATDADNQTLTYTISSDSSNLKFAIYDTATTSYGEPANTVNITKPATQQITCFFDSANFTTDGEAATVTVKANDGFETVTATVVITAR